MDIFHNTNILRRANEITLVAQLIADSCIQMRIFYQAAYQTLKLIL